MNIFPNIAELLTAGENIVLATIVGRSGSAPRAVGTRMVIREDASIVGTIGGGSLEARVRDLARDIFRSRETILRELVLTAEDAGEMGMVCGGEVRILMQFVGASTPFHLHLYQAVASTLEERKRGWLITRIPSESVCREPPVQSVIYRMDSPGVETDDEAMLKWVIAHQRAHRCELVHQGGSVYLVEPLCRQGTVFIFGAGHISQELAPLVKHVGFRTIVLDDREDFAGRHRFADADQVIVLDGFESAIRSLDIDEDSYLVLVTRGHVHDKVLLGQALRTKAGYIGMIGSRRKRTAIFDALAGEGFTSGDFERVHSPIGLDIGAETPEEIAVSIVAELIRTRAGKKG